VHRNLETENTTSRKIVSDNVWKCCRMLIATKYWWLWWKNNLCSNQPWPTLKIFISQLVNNAMNLQENQEYQIHARLLYYAVCRVTFSLGLPQSGLTWIISWPDYSGNKAWTNIWAWIQDTVAGMQLLADWIQIIFSSHILAGLKVNF